jgi:phosphopantothenate synthetase
MDDEMVRAHSRDTRYQNKLRATHSALIELAEDEQTPQGLADVLVGVAERLKKEEDHIVARWN